MANATDDLQETLKPFHKRAAEAEERISRLEAALASNRDTGNEDLLRKINDLKSELTDANSKLASKVKEVEILTAENEKHKYRIGHLVRALREGDKKPEEANGMISRSSEDTASRLKEMKI